MTDQGACDIIVVTETGPVTGLGHVQRCLALGEALSEQHVTLRFIGRCDDQETECRAGVAGHRFEPLNAEPWTVEAAMEIAHRASEIGSRLVVVDARDEHLAFFQTLGDARVPVCLIDDNGNRDIGADYVVNGNVHATSLTYPCVPADRCLLGPRYTMLPRPYWTAAPQPASVPPSRLLVTLGGGDPHNLWPRLLDALSAVPASLVTTVVIGPFVPDTGPLAQALERFARRGVVCRGRRSLADLVVQADLVLTAAGQTLYELAAVGRPAVAVQLAENQVPQLRAFVEAGAVVSAGRATDPEIARDAVDAVIALARQPGRLQRMAASGPRLLDGQGARRVAAAMLVWASGDATSAGSTTTRLASD